MGGPKKNHQRLTVHNVIVSRHTRDASLLPYPFAMSRCWRLAFEHTPLVPFECHPNFSREARLRIGPFRYQALNIITFNHPARLLAHKIAVVAQYCPQSPGRPQCRHQAFGAFSS
jgi:hypothetical protein